MHSGFDREHRRAIRQVLARDAYQAGQVRVADPDLGGCRWLVSTGTGLFAVGPDVRKTVVHGWFFGIHHHGDHVYIFENCGQYDFSREWGRIIRLALAGGHVVEARVLVTGLHGNCHQVRVIDDLLCVVDTVNQRILRFTREGRPIDCRTPFPPAAPGDTTGAYLHMNGIAQVDGRICLMLHNGKAVPERTSELAWLDRDWRVAERVPLPGRHCHDIVADGTGRIWHCASASGEIVSSQGDRRVIAPGGFTRGLAIGDDMVLVGACDRARRADRPALGGWLALLDRGMALQGTIALGGMPQDITVI